MSSQDMAARVSADIELLRQAERLMDQVINAWRLGQVGGWKVRLIRATAACYGGAESVAYLQRALKWIEEHAEGGGR